MLVFPRMRGSAALKWASVLLLFKIMLSPEFMNFHMYAHKDVEELPGISIEGYEAVGLAGPASATREPLDLGDVDM